MGPLTCCSDTLIVDQFVLTGLKSTLLHQYMLRIVKFDYLKKQYNFQCCRVAVPKLQVVITKLRFFSNLFFRYWIIFESITLDEVLANMQYTHTNCNKGSQVALVSL